MNPASSALNSVARALVDARRSARALSAFPGPLPETLDTAYALQVAGIELWLDEIAGWKVGRMSQDLAQRFGVDRFIGPIFRDSVRGAQVNGATPFAMFSGGSAAFEAEFVVYAGRDAKGTIFPASMAIGIEVASSPVATLATLGSLATIADLGNNAGEIIGAPVSVALLTQPEMLRCETRIADDPALARTAEALPGGPAAAFAFAVEAAAHLGFPLRPDQFVSTGAVTGMHVVEPGDRCFAHFGDFGTIECCVTGRAALC